MNAPQRTLRETSTSHSLLAQLAANSWKGPRPIMVVTAPVLDDLRARRGILVNMLQSLGFECLLALNGLEALAIMKPFTANIVETGLRMLQVVVY